MPERVVSRIRDTCVEPDPGDGPALCFRDNLGQASWVVVGIRVPERLLGRVEEILSIDEADDPPGHAVETKFAGKK